MVNFHGEKRRNDTHQSTTDPEARLYRKDFGKEAKLSFMEHVVIDSRHGLVVSTEHNQASGRAELVAVEAMLNAVKGRRGERMTVGADKSYDTNNFVDRMRTLSVTPMWLKTRAIVRVPSMNGQRVTLAAPIVSTKERSSKKSLGG